MVSGSVATHEVPLARALRIRERSEGRVIGEPEEPTEQGNIVLLRDCLRGARRVAANCRCIFRRDVLGVMGPSDPTLRRQGRRRGVLSCRPPRRCVAASCHACSSSNGTDETCAHHACGP